MSTALTIDDLLLSIREHPVHEESVRVETLLPSYDTAARGPTFFVRVIRQSDGVTLRETAGESLGIAASKVLRELNELRDKQVLELRRQVAKLTGNPEVVA